MNLKEFKSYFEQFKENTIFDFGISQPFSWRGIYSEVAFEIIEGKTTKESILENIEKAYSEKFYGYKGGLFQYDDFTDVHFESSHRDYSNGQYCADYISKIEGSEIYEDQEIRLVKLAFIES